MERKHYFWIGLFSVVALVISNTIAGKIVTLGDLSFTIGSLTFTPLTFSVAIILFPLTYICGDVLTEVYGFPAARKVIWGGVFATASASTIYWIAAHMPSAPFYEGGQAFVDTLTTTWRISLASCVAIFVGEYYNSRIVSRLKVLTNKRYLGGRLLGSTVIGQGLDTTIFTFGAFYGLPDMGVEVLVSIVITEYFIKLGYETLMLPVTYRVIAALKRAEGLDVMDYGVRYGMFHLSEST